MSEIAPHDLREGDVVRVLSTGCADGWAMEIVERAPEPEIPVGTTGTAYVPRILDDVRGIVGKDEQGELGIYYIRRRTSTAQFAPWNQVHNFTPDEILTDERAERIANDAANAAHALAAGKERERIGDVLVDLQRIGKTPPADCTKEERLRYTSASESLRTALSLYGDALIAWIRDGAR